MARMGIVGFVRVVLFGVLAFSVVLGRATASFAADAPFMVDTPWASNAGAAIDRFEYNPATGELTFQGDLGPVVLTAFGQVKGLRPSDISVLAADLNRGDKPSTVVLRHGNWVSVVDPVQNKLLASNLGPVLPVTESPEFNRIVYQADGSIIVAFMGKARVGQATAAKPLLFIYNSRDNKLGWLEVRTDVDPRHIRATLFSEDVIRFQGKFLTKLLGDGTSRDGKPTKVMSTSPLDGEMIVDLKSGKVAVSPGADFFGDRKLEKPEMRRISPVDASVAYKSVGVDVSPLKLSETGLAANNVARAAALSKAREQIAFARGVEGHIREAMKDIYGQEEIVEALAKFAQRQVEAGKHSVLLFGGPTGVGKTTGFNAFIRGYLQAVGRTSKQPVFEMSLAEVTDERLLESALFGSKPPYIGSDTPSNLVLWLVNNPEAGGLLFDEIEKAPPAVLEKLISFLEKGEVKLTPFLVQSLCKYYENTPKDEWPRQLRDATNDGANTKSEIILKLTKHHFVGLGTNAGNENFGDSGRGQELKSEQDILQANRRFTGDVIKKELKARGYKGEVLNRIDGWFAFKKLLRKDHVKVVDLRMREVEALFAHKLIEVRFSEGAREFFRTETYDPSSGARNIARQIDAWISQNLNHAIIGNGTFEPGDVIVIDVKAGDGKTEASIMKLSRGQEPKALAEYQVGKPLPPSPRELLVKARKNLVPTLERRIVGHRKEIRLLADAIIGELARAVEDPSRVGRPVVVYFDGTPGIGKTEIAKAVAEALFEDASRLTRVDFNDIVDMNSFYRMAVEKMAGAVKTNPEAQIMLWDELHRLTMSPHRQLIENSLLSVLDEGLLPNPDGKAEKIALSPASIVIATGNMAATALGKRAGSMKNRELQAHFRLMQRHPDSFMDAFNSSFGEAFRSRLGKPLLFMPLTDEQVATLRDRLFDENSKVLRKNGIKASLSESAKDFFLKEYVPMEGGRWVRNTLKLYIENALVTMVVGSEDHFKGSEFEIVWDEAKRELQVNIKRDGQLKETRTLAEVPRTKSDYHPATKERAAWKTSVHEGGHAVVRAVLYGPNSIAEINTFGGGEGGWMEKNFSVPEQEMYWDTRSGIKEIAVSLGGHIAELKHIHKSANGASQDFKTARLVAQTMLIDGSMPDIAPIALITNPSSGQIEMSNEKKVELERKTDFIMEYAAAIAKRILDKNEKVHLEVAKALHEKTDMHMDGRDFARLVEGKLTRLTDAEMELARREAVRAVEVKASMSCAVLLTKAEAVPPAKTSRFRAFWRRILSWFGR